MARRSVAGGQRWKTLLDPEREEVVSKEDEA